MRIATHEYVDIVSDVTGSTSWSNRLSYVLRGPGWAYQRRDQLAVSSLGSAAGLGAGDS
ncbi:MAG: hypothetical protein V9E94_03940 [Microthrixaceae bacterium]